MWRNLTNQGTQLALLACGLVLVISLVGGLSISCGQTQSQVVSCPGSAASIEELVSRFLDKLKQQDREGIAALALNRDEFEQNVWPYLAASEPGTNMTVDFVWGQLNVRSRSSLASLSSRYAGRDYRLQSIRVTGGREEGDGFTLYRDVKLQLEETNGEQRELKLFGSVIEIEGCYKIFSFVR